MMKKQSIPDKNPQYFARAVTGHKNLEKGKGKIIIVYIVTIAASPEMHNTFFDYMPQSDFTSHSNTKN